MVAGRARGMRAAAGPKREGEPVKAPLAGVVVSLLVGIASCSDGTSSQGEDAGVERARAGDTVMVEYTGKLADGTIFESNVEGEARGILIGAEDVLPAFERALVGMAPGEEKRIELAPEEAFGPYRSGEGMIHTLPRSSLAHTLDLEVGQQLNAAVFHPDDPEKPVMVTVTVIELTDDTVTVDANHPLAGKSIYFEVKLVEIL